MLRSEQDSPMDFRILGPLEAIDEGGVVALDAPKQRSLLALLLLPRSESVGSHKLIEDLWAGRPPATAPKVLQTYVSQLRKTLDDDRSSPGRGLRARVEPGVSIARSKRLVAGLEEQNRRPRPGTCGRPRALARPATGRARLRTMGAGRDRPARGASPRGAAGPDRRRARPRPRRRARRGARASWSPSTRCRSACAASSCSRSIARAGRRTRWRPTGAARRRWWRRSGSSRGQRCGSLERAILAQDPALDISQVGPPRPTPSCGRDRPRSSAASASCGNSRAPEPRRRAAGDTHRSRRNGKTRLALEATSGVAASSPTASCWSSSNRSRPGAGRAAIPTRSVEQSRTKRGRGTDQPAAQTGTLLVSTTSSRCSRRRRCSTNCSAGAPGVTLLVTAARRSTAPRSGSSPSMPSSFPTLPAPAVDRLRRTEACACSSIARAMRGRLRAVELNGDASLSSAGV